MKPLHAFSLLLALCLEPPARARWSARRTPDPLEATTLTTVSEIFRGPLEGRRLSVMVDVDTEKSVDIDKLLSIMDDEVYLTRTGGEGDLGPEAFESELEGNIVEGEVPYENVSRELVVAGNIIEVGTTSNWASLHFYELPGLPPDVLVTLVDDQVPWPLVTPPPWWGPSTVLIISLSFQCTAARVFQMELVERTTWVAYLCPIQVPGDQPRFSVLSWQPFDPNQKLLSLGLWEPESFSTFSQLFIDRFKSMGGHTLNVASDDDDAPLLFLDENDEFEGTCKRILDALADTFNFTFTLTHGAPDYDTCNSQFGFALPRPPPLPQWRSLVYPFTWLVWAGVGGILIFTGLVYFLLTYTQPVSPDVSLPGAFGVIMMGLVNQAPTKIPASWSLRMFLAGWWITAYIIVISYNCNLIAVLTVPVYPKRIHTLEQLAVSHYRLCMLDYGEFVPDALLESAEPMMSSLGRKMDLVPVTDEGYYGQEDCAAHVLDDRNAHIETYAYLKLTYADMELLDSVYFMKAQIYEGNLAFFYQKHTPWRRVLDRGLQRLVESGFVAHWQNDIIDRYTKAGKVERDSSPQPLALGHLQGVFFLYGLGLATACLIFLVEYRLIKRKGHRVF
ncbi:uncharacterized protein LOC122246231 [Penaeus japonicus]|uniref:uncharacterized protein LOC122246231 n=1 Tax=Penaeus japonicus TaxID=27405 RepID=UPI001C70D73D|nr:uncharacterized protein LOC122246231 [Penaeus japonicus]